METIRKKPTPADGDAVEVETVQAPHIVERKPFLDPRLAVIDVNPRTPEGVMQNVVARQLADDIANPPDEQEPNPAVEFLGNVQKAKDAGQSLEQYVEPAGKILHAIDIEERLTDAVIRHARVRKIARQLASEEAIDKFLHRCMRRGDLTPREALVFKQLNMNDMARTVSELLDSIERRAGAFEAEDVRRMDFTLQVTEKTSFKQFDGTTPQGREIIRKITLRARKKLIEGKLPV